MAKRIKVILIFDISIKNPGIYWFWTRMCELCLASPGMDVYLLKWNFADDDNFVHDDWRWRW